MRSVGFLLLIFLFIVYAPYAYTEEELTEERYEDYIHAEEGKFKIPPGMELRKIGDLRVLIPKGGKIFKAGDALVVETSGEYAAREFSEIEGRFNKIETEQKALKEEIEYLKETIKRIEK
ncbi:hypothetical protein ACFL60_07930 [Candidatus Omnitrophota bacterium]